MNDQYLHTDRHMTGGLSSQSMGTTHRRDEVLIAIRMIPRPEGSYISPVSTRA